VNLRVVLRDVLLDLALVLAPGRGAMVPGGVSLDVVDGHEVDADSEGLERERKMSKGQRKPLRLTESL